MSVLVVLVMHVAVLVLQHLMLVIMLVPFG
jgi:hypothetical protein